MYYQLAVENKKFLFYPFLREHQKNQAHVREMFRFFCPLLEVKLLLLLREHKMYIIPSKRGSDIFHWPSFVFVFVHFHKNIYTRKEENKANTRSCRSVKDILRLTQALAGLCKAGLR